MIVGARTNFAVGRDWPAAARLGAGTRSAARRPTALRVQGVAALLLVGVGAAAGGGFKPMVEFTAPVFWLFFLLAGLSLFVLRVREPHARAAVQGAAVPAAAAAVLRRLRLHAVVEPVVRLQPGARRLQRRVDRRRGAGRRRRCCCWACARRKRRDRRASRHPLPSAPTSGVTHEALPTQSPLIRRRARAGRPAAAVVHGASAERPTPGSTCTTCRRQCRWWTGCWRWRGVKRGDMLYDLGCGDGRIVVTAAKSYGARGVGIDLDPERIKEARANARREAWTDRCSSACGDLFEANLRRRTS